MGQIRNKIAVVTRQTRLQGLMQRWSTKGAARFLLQQVRVHQGATFAESDSTTLAALEQAASDAEFAQYEQEDENYREVLDQLRRDLNLGFPVEFIDRHHLANYDFDRCILVIVVGQDGLVANTAKYVDDLPLVAVNPDASQYDGILLPFTPSEISRTVRKTLDGRCETRSVTLAEVNLNDGQHMLAFNDFFIGVKGHSSARYLLSIGGNAEPQSSSGVIVSTGAGSTGWFSSIFNMHNGMARWLGTDAGERVTINWEDRKLMWAVREPFKSRHSETALVAGTIEDDRELVIESLMPMGGIIFSDGVETDYLEFNSGTIARIGCAQQRARLVVGA